RRAARLAPTATLDQATTDEQVQARKVSRELGGLPLALDQVGAYLEETGCDLDTYLQVYQQHRIELLNERRSLVNDHPDPVATTRDISFQRVKQRNPAAAELLSLCAFFAPDAIPEEILTGSADPFLLNQSIEVARAYSLLRRDP